jgi:hypothetical protein
MTLTRLCRRFNLGLGFAEGDGEEPLEDDREPMEEGVFEVVGWATPEKWPSFTGGSRARMAWARRFRRQG